MEKKRILKLFIVQVIFTIMQPLFASDSSERSLQSPASSTYATNSVLSENRFYKIRVAKSGVYKLTFDELATMGVDPANVRIFGYGGAILNRNLALMQWDDLPEVAIWMEKGADDVFNAGDYVLFYAQGPISWNYDKNRAMFVHATNTYSNYGYYFVSSGGQNGKRINKKSVITPQGETVNNISEFTDLQVYENDMINLINSGKEFYGEIFGGLMSYNFSFNFPNIIQREDNLKVRFDVATSSTVASNLLIRLENNQDKILNLYPKSMYDSSEAAKATSATFTFNPPKDNCLFNLTYNTTSTNLSATAYLNFIEVNAQRQLKMTGSAMVFQNVDYLGTNTFNRYTIDGISSDVQIWDITNQVNIEKLEIERTTDKITFIDSASVLKHYLAIDTKASSTFPTPEMVGAVPNQNIHSIQQADMVIITHPNFTAQAETLAQAHRQKDNMTVAVVTTEQVYNEFSSGTPDATAYRRVLRMFYDRATEAGKISERPKYLLLFGKGSFDNRKILNDSGENLILTYQADNSLVKTISYVTDDYFTYLKDRDGVQVSSYMMDVAVGRFPVTTTQQATDVVNKTIRYMNNTDFGNWKNQLLFVADDGNDNAHISQADEHAQTLSKKLPAFHTNKVYLDAFLQTSESFIEPCPPANEKLLSVLNSGMFYVNYTGHGSERGWTGEKLLTDSNAMSLTNVQLPLWVSASCDLSNFDSKIVTAAEQVVLNPNGGGIGILSAARPVFSSPNFYLNKQLLQNLFTKENGQYPRIGDAILNAKNSLGTEINKLSFIYLGDPAVRLNYADKYHVVTTKINDNDYFTGNDTLRAKSSNTIKGYIADENNQKVTDFNGKVYVSIYDKMKTITTFGNENTNAKKFDFMDRTAILSSEAVTVSSGDFSYSFTLPDSINNDFGEGKIIYYAVDETKKNEAQGYFTNFIVGGNEITAGIHFPTISESEYFIKSYPNPARDFANFNVSSQSNIVSFTIEITDLTGKHVHTISTSGLNGTSWNLTTANGQKLSPGVYFYYAKIKTTETTIRTALNKLIIN
jgi:hypothetical protein